MKALRRRVSALERANGKGAPSVIVWRTSVMTDSEVDALVEVAGRPAYVLPVTMTMAEWTATYGSAEDAARS